MDILHKTVSRFSVTSQTTSHNIDTTKLRHSRRLSYEQVITPSTVDYLVSLCAGRNASIRLERMRMLVYFQGIPETPNTIASENWAKAVGGEIAGERDAQPSFRTPWAEPNSGITFRYRHHGATPSTSCSTNCTTFNHHPQRSSISSSSPFTTILTPSTAPPILVIPNGDTLQVCGEVVEFQATRDTYGIDSQSQAGPSNPKTSYQQHNSRTKQVRFDAVSRPIRYERKPFEGVPEEDICHFNEYPNTFKGLKDPTEHIPPPEKRRVERTREYFVNTPWRLPPGPLTGHCREFIRQRDYNPLALCHTIEPAKVSRNVAIREALILKSRGGRPVPSLIIPTKASSRPAKKFPPKADVRPVSRAGPTPRPFNVSQAATKRSMYSIR